MLDITKMDASIVAAWLNNGIEVGNLHDSVLGDPEQGNHWRVGPVSLTHCLWFKYTKFSVASIKEYKTIL